jgi:hypothetical protein|tara:strand:+ start:10184 stop:14188 length:4005 start_codon:yes stop_codon:yes gene_type:complete
MATPVSADKYQFQFYKQSDSGLIPQVDIDTTLTGSSFIEFSIYTLNDELVFFNSSYKRYTVLDDSPSSGEGISQFDIEPDIDVQTQGYDSGEYVAYYNFVTNRIGSQFQQLYISEISSDRTELRLESTTLSNFDIEDQTDDFIDFREENIYFTDFQLNFSNNQLVIANNIRLDEEDENNPSILIKLYEPLPPQFQLQSQLYVVTTFANPEAFAVNYIPQVQSFIDSFPLQGPNFNIPIKGEVNNSSLNLSENDILLGGSTGSYNQLQGLLSQSSINISIDYSDYNEFIHFSSAQTRLENFYYKASLLEQYSGSVYELQSTSGSSSSITLFENKISSIVTNFDNYDKFLYYQSGSKSWPKTNSTEPYELAGTGSIEVLQWYGSLIESNAYYGGQLYNAWFFDNQNPDQLLKSIPEYLREDQDNQPYELFVDMVAQYYDNVWIYTKDVSQKYNADNRLDFGISKDLVSDAIKDFSLKLYQNNFSNQELYTAFLGITPSGSLFPFPEISQTLPVPTGMEFVNTLISASNDVISMDDTNKSLYKRIYHNIPYLLKSKGTTAGLRALITSYGIPDTILKISEFGGKDKVNANDWDLYSNNFNYALEVGPGVNYISSSFVTDSDWNATFRKPQTVEFRFKPEKLTTTSSPYGLTNLSQSLFTLEYGAGGPQYLDIVLEYSGSGLSTGSYLGAPKDPNYQYGNLKLIPNTGGPETSASISLPFFNGDWWSVMLTSDLSTGLTLSTGNKIYNGNDGTSLGFYDTASIIAGNPWSNSNKSYFSKSSLYPGFSGSLQEVRYYKPIISQSVFKDYIMNPLSFEGNGVNSAPDQLIFRAALGSELDITTSSSIHPKATGSWAITSSFNKSNSFYFNRPPQYTSNTEYFFQDQPAAGIKNRITDKIRWENNVLPGNTLSQYKKIAQTTEASASYSENINYLEVAFSPQNQINDDIIGQIGHFNIGDYIGDPRQRSSRSIIYPDLNNLSEDYFKKYIKQYDLVDFVRLIKFFDNSLFKMIKDFVPARTSLASGLVIKQHLLERDKYPHPQMSYTKEDLSGCIKTHHIWNTASQETEISCSRIVTAEGGPAGMFNPFNNNYFTTTTTSSQTTEFRYSGSLGLINAPIELTNYIDFPSFAPSTNAPNLEWFNRFVTASYIEDPNLWVTISPTQANQGAFYSGSNYVPVKVAKVSSINLGAGRVVLASGYTISAEAVIAENATFLTASISNATTFASSSTSIITETTYTFSTPPQFNITQSWEVTEPTLSGSITYTHDSQDEFYNGELSGSEILVTNGELNEEIGWAKNPSYATLPYRLRVYSSASYNEDDFNSLNNDPIDGFISIYNNFE